MGRMSLVNWRLLLLILAQLLIAFGLALLSWSSTWTLPLAVIVAIGTNAGGLVERHLIGKHDSPALAGLIAMARSIIIYSALFDSILPVLFSSTSIVGRKCHYHFETFAFASCSILVLVVGITLLQRFSAILNEMITERHLDHQFLLMSGIENRYNSSAISLEEARERHGLVQVFWNHVNACFLILQEIVHNSVATLVFLLTLLFLSIFYPIEETKFSIALFKIFLVQLVVFLSSWGWCLLLLALLAYAKTNLEKWINMEVGDNAKKADSDS